MRTLTLEVVRDAVKGSAAAFRCRRRLQPAGGEGDKVFPPAFAGGVYAIEQRRIAGRAEPVTCVLGPNFERAVVSESVGIGAWPDVDPPAPIRRALAALCKVTRIGQSSSLVLVWLAAPEGVGEPTWVTDGDRAAPRAITSLGLRHPAQYSRRFDKTAMNGGDTHEEKNRCR